MATPEIIDIRGRRLDDSLTDQVIRGLESTPKTLPALLFYTNEGLEHWNRHARQPDFYPHHQEMGILQSRGAEMAASMAPDTVILDLGSANLDKVGHLLQALEAQHKPVSYYALDLSFRQLESTLKSVSTSNFKHVRCFGLHGTFDDGLRWVRETPGIKDRPHCALLLGLTIGNFSRENAASFLRDIADHALAGGGDKDGDKRSSSSILVSVDSCKVPTQVIRAYTSDGVEPFALQSLTYMKTLFDRRDRGAKQCRLDPNDWHYLSRWNFVLGRHEASLVPRAGDVHLGPALGDIVVRADESVRFGCSYKYNAEERGGLFREAGLEQRTAWGDGDVVLYDLRRAAVLT